jgi:hypothetical protein
MSCMRNGRWSQKLNHLSLHAFEQVLAKRGVMEERSAPDYLQPDTCAHLYLCVGLAAARI